ncbi:acyltransferase [Gemmata obscuriglobus]|uniref:Acyltransferase n=1 Tax=Gemmata obscuriglobus TaxID=114 RepID=A0A2Z3H5X4_9BACT|nr:acyltransferase [Gemmata obscuriglobus]
MARVNRLPAVDALRGAAALAVVLFHYTEFFALFEVPAGPAGSAVLAVTRCGHLGGPVFFALSGYVIASTAQRYQFTPGTGFRFVLRRLVRTVSLCWAMLTFITLSILAGTRWGCSRTPRFRSTSCSRTWCTRRRSWVTPRWTWRTGRSAWRSSSTGCSPRPRSRCARGPVRGPERRAGRRRTTSKTRIMFTSINMALLSRLRTGPSGCPAERRVARGCTRPAPPFSG